MDRRAFLGAAGAGVGTALFFPQKLIGSVFEAAAERGRAVIVCLGSESNPAHDEQISKCIESLKKGIGLKNPSARCIHNHLSGVAYRIYEVDPSRLLIIIGNDDRPAAYRDQWELDQQVRNFKSGDVLVTHHAVQPYHRRGEPIMDNNICMVFGHKSLGLHTPDFLTKIEPQYSCKWKLGITWTVSKWPG